MSGEPSSLARKALSFPGMTFAFKERMGQAKHLAYSWEALAIVGLALMGAASLIGVHFLIRW